MLFKISIMKKTLILLISISFFLSNNMIAQSKKELKKQQQKEDYQRTKELIENGNFVFEADWATSYKGRRVNVAGDSYDLVIKNDSCIAYLPFYGRAFSGAGYGGDGGIKFETENVSYDIKHNDKKVRTKIKFQVKHKSENYDIFLTVYSNGNANLSVSSSNRSTMNYDGKIVPFKEKEEKKKDKK